MFAHPIGDDTDLRILQSRHAAALFRVTDANREHLRRWLPWLDATRGEADSAAFIRTMLTGFSERGTFACGIWHQGELCGVVGYNHIDWANGRAQIGYWLAASHTGRGLMTTACRALVTHAFDAYGLHRVEIPVATENRPSQAIPERMGFRQEGVLRGAEWLYDRYVDHTLNALLRDEFEAARDAR